MTTAGEPPREPTRREQERKRALQQLQRKFEKAKGARERQKDKDIRRCPEYPDHRWIPNANGGAHCGFCPAEKSS